LHSALILGFLPLWLCSTASAQEKTLGRIAFGSCAKQDKPQPIWDAIVEAKPELFLFIGDNIYGDTKDMAVMREKYSLLGAQPGYQKLKAACPILATWDDHDFGANDAGAEYPLRRESQTEFLDFFGVPAESPRRQREGVYDARLFGPPDKRAQIILLDTRYFRSPLSRTSDRRDVADGVGGRYLPDESKDATVLGDAQWKWLEEQLRTPAELRIIASSIQFVSEEHGFEKWSNLPRERERMVRLIGETRARGVIFISGDRHSAELSRLDHGSRPSGDNAAGVLPRYPLYDLTSSALNQPRGWMNELNRHRLGNCYFEPNFGLILIDWNVADPQIQLCIHDIKGKLMIRHTLALSELGGRS
jgi:alkaline phosphatase D